MAPQYPQYNIETNTSLGMARPRLTSLPPSFSDTFRSSRLLKLNIFQLFELALFHSRPWAFARALCPLPGASPELLPG